MDRRTIALSATLAMLGVILGAFGAHGLKPRITPDALDQWHTGVQYQFIHALGLLALGGMAQFLPVGMFRVIRALFLAGTLAFSGSLYVLATRGLGVWPDAGTIVGPITPLGGVFFIAGWALLLITMLRKPGQRKAAVKPRG